MRRLIIDTSSIARAGLHAGRDEENGYSVEFEGKQHWINSAQYGVDRFVTSYSNLLKDLRLVPINTILVLDGYNSRQMRSQIYPHYKAKRKPLPPQFLEEYSKMLGNIQQLILDLGGSVMEQPGMEADDVIAFLAQRLHGQKIIWSRDGDMLALRGPEVDVFLKDEMNPDHYKDVSASMLDVYKALCGDPSDNLPGAKGFGPKAFQDFIALYGRDGVEEIRRIIKDCTFSELDDHIQHFKPFQKVKDSYREVRASWLCAQFYTDHIDTLHNPLRIQTGYVKEYGPDSEPELQPYYASRTLIQPGDALPDFTGSPYVAFDLETYTPPESDPWVEAIQNSGKSKKEKRVVDVFGSIICGASFTYGPNMQHTIYIPFAHSGEDGKANLPLDWLKAALLSVPYGTLVAVHNSAFELPVTNLNLGDLPGDEVWQGFIPNVWDTRIMKQYVDENTKSGLKECSKLFFAYEQQTYDDATGGKKMNELSASHVFSYGCDDTIMTAALFNRLLLSMELENSVGIFEDVEFYTQYAVAQMFIDGVDIDMSRLRQLEADDAVDYEAAKVVLHSYLAEHGWSGCEYQPFDYTSTMARSVFEQLQGEKLNTSARKIDKLTEQMRLQGAEDLADAIDEERADDFLRQFHTGEADFSTDSPKQVGRLLYDVMKLPVRLYNDPTDKMIEVGIARGLKRKDIKGNPKTDVWAVKHALAYDVADQPEIKAVLEAMQVMATVNTRRELYYEPYPLLRHWSDGLIHPNLGQSSAATLRFTPNGPNLNQMPKKGDGIKVREIVVAPPGCVVMSLDQGSQELRLIAEKSQDPAMLSCYVGDDLKDIHSLTGVSISKIMGGEIVEYALFASAVKEGHKEAKKFRGIGKTVNFGTLYGMGPGKLSIQLIVSDDEARSFIAAKEQAFPGVEAWKAREAAFARANGYTLTLMGKRRHLADSLRSKDKQVVSHAERQGVNYTIQGSAAEQIKLCISRMWKSGCLFNKGIRLMFPVHDELVFAVDIEALVESARQANIYMTMPYATAQIPFVAPVSFGPSFGTQHECGDQFDAATIQAVAAKEMSL